MLIHIYIIFDLISKQWNYLGNPYDILLLPSKPVFPQGFSAVTLASDSLRRPRHVGARGNYYT